jgi:RNA polymerase sigma-70 factor (ECF subfamily)
MTKRRDEFLPTRQSLLQRLKRWDDQESWRDFFNQYWRLLYSAAIKAGLNDSQAQDVVQDTIILVSKKMEGFRYDPLVDSFKGWLLYLTRKRIALEYRRIERMRQHKPVEPNELNPDPDIEALPDLEGPSVEKVSEDELHKFMWDAAIARVKGQVALKQFQLFDLYVVKERPAREVAQALGVAVAQVYLAKHRVSALVKHELLQLKAKLE